MSLNTIPPEIKLAETQPENPKRTSYTELMSAKLNEAINASMMRRVRVPYEVVSISEFEKKYISDGWSAQRDEKVIEIDDEGIHFRGRSGKSVMAWEFVADSTKKIVFILKGNRVDLMAWIPRRGNNEPTIWVVGNR